MITNNPRMDVLSRKRLPKEELLRLVLADGKYVPDVSGKAPGRGIYVIRDAELLLANRKRLEKTLRHVFEETEFHAILEALK